MRGAHLLPREVSPGLSTTRGTSECSGLSELWRQRSQFREAKVARSCGEGRRPERMELHKEDSWDLDGIRICNVSEGSTQGLGKYHWRAGGPKTTRALSGPEMVSVPANQSTKNSYCKRSGEKTSKGIDLVVELKRPQTKGCYPQTLRSIKAS